MTKFEELPYRLRNAAAGIIKAMRGPGITDAERVAVFAVLDKNFCGRCGAAKSTGGACACACLPPLPP